MKTIGLSWRNKYRVFLDQKSSVREYDTIHSWSVNWDPQSDAEINNNNNNNNNNDDNNSRPDLANIANTKRLKC